ncbi:MAG: ABC transporter substrate-binding protein [Dehalococcoidia bacterium]|nr:ABC transporter substrate-binding protein [Dehalococcoidia bacterium]
MKGTKLILSMVLSVVLIATLLGACKSAAPAVDPGKKTLKIGMTNPLTGVAAEKGNPMGAGNLDAIEYINNELGGIDGHKIEALALDDGYDAAKATTIVKRFIDEGYLFFTTASSAMMTAMMENANRASFPGIVAFSASNLTQPPQRIYGQTPDYGDDWAAFAKYYMSNIWKDKSRKPRMALHLLNNSTGAAAKKAAEAKAVELGIELVIIKEHAATTSSEIASLTEIKSKNPDVLYISSTPAPTSVIIKNAKELGMYPGITIASGHAGITKALVDLGGADVVEGVYGVYPTVQWGENVPGMAKMTEYVRKNHPKYEGNADYIVSWAQSLIAAEILRLAVKNAGADKLTPQIVEEQGFKKLKNFDVGGLHGPVTYTPGDNRLSKSVRVIQVQKGKLVPVTGWVEAPLIQYAK